MGSAKEERLWPTQASEPAAPAEGTEATETAAGSAATETTSTSRAGILLEEEVRTRRVKYGGMTIAISRLLLPPCLQLTVAFTAAILVGCEKAEQGQPVRPAQLQVRSGRWSCEEWPRANHYAKACNVDLTLDTSYVDSWRRIGCYGEFSFTQISDGKVSQLRQGFFDSMIQEGSDWPKSFRVVAWVNFPVAYQALDPKLSWYQCKVLAPEDDRHALGPS